MKYKHSFCKTTRYCVHCGMPADWLARYSQPLTCYARNVTSLDWWRKLKAHEKLQQDLERSVALELGDPA